MVHDEEDEWRQEEELEVIGEIPHPSHTLVSHFPRIQVIDEK